MAGRDNRAILKPVVKKWSTQIQGRRSSHSQPNLTDLDAGIINLDYDHSPKESFASKPTTKRTPRRSNVQARSIQSSVSSTGSVSTVESVFEEAGSPVDHRSPSPITPPQESKPFELPSYKDDETSPSVNKSYVLVVPKKDNLTATFALPYRLKKLSGTISLDDDTNSPCKKPARRKISSAPSVKETSSETSQTPTAIQPPAKRRLSGRPGNPKSNEPSSNKVSRRGDSPECHPMPFFERYHDKFGVDKALPEVTREINESIMRCMLAGIKAAAKVPAVTTDESPKETPYVRAGYIYILESVSHAPGHVKIGKTKTLPEMRKRAWDRCEIPLRVYKDSFQHAFHDFHIIESIIHLDLQNARKKYRCRKCSLGKEKRMKSRAAAAAVEERHDVELEIALAEEEACTVDYYHGEWFEVGPATALKILNRWRSWIIKHKPFDAHGQLTPYWKWRAQRAEMTVSDIEWDTWTQPWFGNCWRYNVCKWFDMFMSHLNRKDIWFCRVGTFWVFGNFFFNFWYAVLTMAVLIVI
jgi:hypothetical protein